MRVIVLRWQDGRATKISEHYYPSRYTGQLACNWARFSPEFGVIIL